MHIGGNPRVAIGAVSECDGLMGPGADYEGIPRAGLGVPRNLVRGAPTSDLKSSGTGERGLTPVKTRPL